MADSSLIIKTNNPAGYTQPTYSQGGTFTNSRTMPANPPPGATASQGSWQQAPGGWQWVDYAGYNYQQTQKEAWAAAEAEQNQQPAAPTELTGAFSAPNYRPFALQQRQQQMPGGAFGGQQMAGGNSTTLVPQLEQLRMQRMVQAYPQFGSTNSGGMYGVR